MELQELNDAARALSGFKTALALAERLKHRRGVEFERALRTATKHLDYVDRALAAMDAPQPQQAMLTISPILRARLDALHAYGVGTDAPTASSRMSALPRD